VKTTEYFELLQCAVCGADDFFSVCSLKPEAFLGKNREYYNLDVIISVGYRVKFLRLPLLKLSKLIAITHEVIPAFLFCCTAIDK